MIVVAEVDAQAAEDAEAYQTAMLVAGADYPLPDRFTVAARPGRGGFLVTDTGSPVEDGREVLIPTYAYVAMCQFLHRMFG